jgi:uncharacterized membrane protein
MRTARDRVRHALLYEVLGLALIIPLGVWGFQSSAHQVGALAVAGSTFATFQNFLYNVAFDHAMLRITGSTSKSVGARVAHAVLFELCLLVVLLPAFAWELGVTLMEAFMMDLSFAAFYVVYALVFSWGYDTIFPVAGDASVT